MRREYHKNLIATQDKYPTSAITKALKRSCHTVLRLASIKRPHTAFVRAVIIHVVIAILKKHSGLPVTQHASKKPVPNSLSLYENTIVQIRM